LSIPVVLDHFVRLLPDVNSLNFVSTELLVYKSSYTHFIIWI
jgi:hypothetical protein